MPGKESVALLLRGGNLPQPNLRRVKTLGPAASLKRIFCDATRRRTIEKYPWSVLLFGRDAEASCPPRMLTQCVGRCQRAPWCAWCGSCWVAIIALRVRLDCFIKTAVGSFLD